MALCIQIKLLCAATCVKRPLFPVLQGWLLIATGSTLHNENKASLLYWSSTIKFCEVGEHWYHPTKIQTQTLNQLISSVTYILNEIRSVEPLRGWIEEIIENIGWKVFRILFTRILFYLLPSIDGRTISCTSFPISTITNFRLFLWPWN